MDVFNFEGVSPVGNVDVAVDNASQTATNTVGPIGNADQVQDNASNASRGGRPLQLPRHYDIGQYGSQRCGSHGGKNTDRVPSSRAPKHPLRGIGAPHPRENVEPFVQIYIPGSTLSTLAYVVPLGRRGPMINSNAEDPVAKQHKRIVSRPGRRGVWATELRNENSKIEGEQTTYHGDEEEILGSEGDAYNDEEDEIDGDCDEALEDADVRIQETHPAGPSTQEHRRSSRLNNVVATALHDEDNFST